MMASLSCIINCQITCVDSYNLQANSPPGGPVSCKYSSNRPACCKWSSGQTGLLQTIIRKDQSLANNYPEGPTSCKWSSVTPTPLPGSRFNLADPSRPICSCFWHFRPRYHKTVTLPKRPVKKSLVVSRPGQTLKANDSLSLVRNKIFPNKDFWKIFTYALWGRFRAFYILLWCWHLTRFHNKCASSWKFWMKLSHNFYGYIFVLNGD